MVPIPDRQLLEPTGNSQDSGPRGPGLGLAAAAAPALDRRVTPPLVWIDLEMSGLDPERCAILEIAVIVTDSDLTIVAEGPDIIVHQDDAVLDAMDDWCTTHHGKSGLTAAVRASTVSLGDAEQRCLEFLKRHTEAGTSPLCGNSVWQDRRFLVGHMPELDGFLHYRLIDVSTVKELVKRWYPDLQPPRKAETHRALEDIRESIGELRLYRDTVFKK
jgi:oligoribonuclease